MLKSLIFLLIQTVLVVKTYFITPVFRLLSIIFPNSFISKRIRFEQDLEYHYSVSFSATDDFADSLFHVSSEGELEQVFPLMRSILEAGKLIELVYTSPSVDAKCREVAKKYYPHVRILPLPIMATLSDVDLDYWATAKKMVMCRYDFFPELLYLTKRMDENWLVGASVKKYASKLSSFFSFSRYYWIFIFQFFTKITPASEFDRMLIRSLTNSKKVTSVFDFRVLQIFSRLENKQDALERSNLLPLLDFLKAIPNRLIVGSGWQSEVDAILYKGVQEQIEAKELSVYFAPHRLDDEFYEAFLKKVLDFSTTLKVYRIKRGADAREVEDVLSSYQQCPGIIYSQVPGVLCELYSYSTTTLVGGGWGRSIHSVLEPFLAQNFVICGNKTHRSTEVDLISEWKQDEVFVINSPVDFSSVLKQTIGKSVDSKMRFDLYQSYLKEYDLLIKDSARYVK